MIQAQKQRLSYLATLINEIATWSYKFNMPLPADKKNSYVSVLEGYEFTFSKTIAQCSTNTYGYTARTLERVSNYFHIM